MTLPPANLAAAEGAWPGRRPAARLGRVAGRPSVGGAQGGVCAWQSR